ncbi:DNA recombination protein RmuC [Tistlia consotensis]|uniref:DNA recombination protein RmuC homolog n=1 Tax=Tistlia consotensis USBA 355 TaxID=560819 RepID=A0A1Y6BG92_9PROT|nr:DNA recombination protein RmuC [Tistlia consotensis]SMF07682.1 DNA recombination protein RmuC [Tistlia consotensis USBA 355]SNR35754.1 DNA recombination protein RmuC [Tistlia consotensis]
MELQALLIGALGLALGALVALLLLRRPSGGRGDDTAELEARLRQLAESQAATQAQTAEALRGQERALAEALDARFGDFAKKVGDRLQEGAQAQGTTLGELRERLAVIDKAQQNITQLSTQVVGLQDILSNKQARGAFGEVQLHDLVTSILPPSAYAFQAALPGNVRVDCLLLLPNPPGSIAIDSKFPLESYRALRDAPDDAGRQAAVRSFRQDVRNHVKAIRDKYIVPGETAESALLFLPSEAVYAELHANFSELVEESYRARVWIVSPTTLMATLNTVRAVLKDVRMREQAGLIQAEVQRLLEDVKRLDERAGRLQKHFDQATNDLREIRISTEKVTKRGERIEEVQVEAVEPDAALAPAPLPGQRAAE